MKFSVALLVASLCVLACLEAVAVTAKAPSGELTLQSIQQILLEAGISAERLDQFFENERKAGMKNFVQSMNAALVTLLSTANLEE